MFGLSAARTGVGCPLFGDCPFLQTGWPAAGGQVRTRVSLDREAGGHYWLEVVARDLAVVPREARLDLHVAVGDRNDGVPLSAQPAYEGTLREDASRGTHVLALGELRDPDSAHVRRRLLSGSRPCPSETCPFALGEGSSLVVAGPLDREAQPQHVLQLELSDDGQPSLSSTSQVRVALIDVDDHPARFVQPLFRFRLPDGAAEQGLCQVGGRPPWQRSVLFEARGRPGHWAKHETGPPFGNTGAEVKPPERLPCKAPQGCSCLSKGSIEPAVKPECSRVATLGTSFRG